MSNTHLSDEARHLALVPLFGQLSERELAKLADEVDRVSFLNVCNFHSIQPAGLSRRTGELQ